MVTKCLKYRVNYTLLFSIFSGLLVVQLIYISTHKRNFAWARSVVRISRWSSEPQIEGSKPSGLGFSKRLDSFIVAAFCNKHQTICLILMFNTPFSRYRSAIALNCDPLLRRSLGPS